MQPQSRLGSWSARLSALCVLAILAVSCGGSDVGTENQAATQLGAVVTGEAATALNGAELFTLPRASEGSEITADAAERLAVAHLTTYEEFLRPRLEEGRGAPIRVAGLTPCGRTLYAQSSYEALTGDVARPIQSAFGGWWVVTVCDGGSAAAIVAVSALATDVSVGTGNVLKFAKDVAGNEFLVSSVSPSHSFGRLVTPEEAVLSAHSRTGKRIRAVPSLVAASIGNGGPLGG
jgi:hypothetical protein